MRRAMALAGLLALAPFVALAEPRHHGHDGGGGGGYPPPRMDQFGPWGRPPPFHPATVPPFDPRHHNGYWVGHRWYYGPPPDAAPSSPDFRPGFAPFRPGAYLPPQYQASIIGDWGRYHLRRPPYGYQWVRAGDEFLLVSMSTNQIFDVVSDDF